MELRCDNCEHYGDSGAGEPGYCLWGKRLPPGMRQMLAAQEAEPTAQIAHTAFDGMEISTEADGWCSAHAPTKKEQSDG